MSELSPQASISSLRSTRVGWFELFYDLVVVASVSYGSKLYIADPTWGMGTWLFLSLIVLMTFWLLTMVSHNLFPKEDVVRRLLVVVQMMGLVVASLSLVRSSDGLPDEVGFASLAVSFASIALVYLRCRRDDSEVVGAAKVLARSTGGAALIMVMGFLVARFVGAAADPYLVWILLLGLACGILPLLFVVLNRDTTRRLIDREHLSERMGQLLLIVLGESFIALVFDLSGQASIPNPVYFLIDFAVVFSIWTIYFTSVLPGGLPRGAGRLRVWIALHCLLMFGAIVAAGTFASLTLLPFGSDPGTEGFWTPLPLFYVTAALFGLSILSRSHRVSSRIDAGVVGIMLVLSILALWVVPGQARYLTLIAAAIIVIDAGLSAAIVQRREREGTLSK